MKEEQERRDVMSEWVRLYTPGISLEKRNRLVLYFCSSAVDAFTLDRVAGKLESSWDIGDKWLLDGACLDSLSANEMVLSLSKHGMLSSNFIAARGELMEARRKDQEDAARRAREEAAKKAREEAERKAREEADKKAGEEAENKRLEDLHIQYRAE